MQTSDFDFLLPPELIAQSPAPARDQSRLLLLERNTQSIIHRHFPDLLAYLRPGDVLVLNNSRVIPARLRGVNAGTSGQFEILLLEENSTNDWWVMLRPGKRARVGTEIILRDANGNSTGVRAKVVATNDEGHRRLEFSSTSNIRDLLDTLGEIPLPPYIERKNSTNLADDKIRYQTVYAAPPGSVAAPTAGLHFTEALLEKIRAVSVRVCFVTLKGGGKFEITQTKYRLTEEQKQDDGQKLFDFCAESLKAFIESNIAERGITVGSSGELPLGFTVRSFLSFFLSFFFPFPSLVSLKL